MGPTPPPLLSRMPLLVRALAVTLGLAVAGAAVGGFAAVVAAAAFCLAIFGWPTAPPDAFLFSVVAGVGAVLGAALGPAVGWAAMRHVALGAGVAGTAVGAAAGAVAGLVAGLLAGRLDPLTSAVAGAALGAAGVGVGLDVRARRARLDRLPPSGALRPSDTPGENGAALGAVAGATRRAPDTRG